MGGEWERLTWGQIATLEYGKALASYNEMPNKARVYGTNGPIGWHSQALWRGPGIVIGRKGAYRGVHFTNEPYWVIDTAYSLQPKRPFDLRWAYYQLKTVDLNSVDDGSPIPSTTRPAFYALPVLLPSRREQDAIADILGVLDDKNDLNRGMAATLEQIARALFKSWFVDFDPVRAKAEGRPTGLPDDIAALFPDRFGDDGLPAEWDRRPLSSVARFLNGLALQKYPAESAEHSLPVIKIAEMTGGPTSKSDRASLDVPSAYHVNDGDHLFAWSGSLGHCRWTYGPGALNQHLFKVAPNEGIPGWFVYEAVELHMDEFRAIASDKAVTMGHIQRKHLDAVFVATPSNEVLGKLSAVIAPIETRSLATARESRRLAALRDTLLPKLISGELRVADAEKRISAA